MKETEEALVELGLTLTEAKIYLAGLGQESVGIQELGKKTGVKRPTIYHVMYTLTEKGLVSEKKINNKLQFTMCAPVQIAKFIEQQKQLIIERQKKLEAIIPTLSTWQDKKSKQEITSVSQYQGIEGVKTVFDIAFYCKSRHWDIIAPISNFLGEYDKQYSEYYLNARKYHQITSRTLWEYHTDGQKVSPHKRKLTLEEIRQRNPRFMPISMHGKFKSMMILFDDKIAIISPLEKLSAVLITSKEVHKMFSSMFQSIWDISEEYK